MSEHEETPTPPPTPSDESTDAQLGAMPPAEPEEPELVPGGADSIDDPKYGETPGPPTIPDTDPAANPAVEDAAPDEISELDDKQQEPDDDAATLDAPGDHNGEPEPPA